MKTKFFRLAQKISKLSNHPKFKMGAIITKKNRAISMGINQMKTHRKSPSPYSFLHCEIDAILNSKLANFHKCSIYIYRELKNGSLGTSKPCTHCYNLLKELNFKNIYYCDYKGYLKL